MKMNPTTATLPSEMIMTLANFLLAGACCALGSSLSKRFMGSAASERKEHFH